MDKRIFEDVLDDIDTIPSASPEDSSGDVPQADFLPEPYDDSAYKLNFNFCFVNFFGKLRHVSEQKRMDIITRIAAGIIDIVSPASGSDERSGTYAYTGAGIDGLGSVDMNRKEIVMYGNNLHICFGIRAPRMSISRTLRMFNRVDAALDFASRSISPYGQRNTYFCFIYNQNHSEITTLFGNHGGLRMMRDAADEVYDALSEMPAITPSFETLLELCAKVCQTEKTDEKFRSAFAGKLMQMKPFIKKLSI